jgi:hypothetical protein
MQFAVATFVSAVIVLAAPFMGQLQSLLRRSLSTQHYVLLFGAGVLAAVAFAMLLAVRRIRDRRAQRFGLLAIAIGFGGGYMWATATPWQEVNAVERVHFVEYGVIALLFYRAWRAAGDPSIVVLPLLAAFAVGTVDEWLQWFIPVRVGEAHDVFLNLAAIVCGLLFAIALLPPASFTARLHPESWRRIGVATAAVWLIFAAFVSQVHLGHVIAVPGIGAFRSHYTAAELEALQADRAAAWRTQPPSTLRRLSREDQYLDEGLWHVRRRNIADLPEAWHENLILERYFAPVLDTPTYASPTGNRWPPEQRADVATRAPAVAAFTSTAEPYPIVAWPAGRFWMLSAAIAVALAAIPFAIARRQPDIDSRAAGASGGR